MRVNHAYTDQITGFSGDTRVLSIDFVAPPLVMRFTTRMARSNLRALVLPETTIEEQTSERTRLSEAPLARPRTHDSAFVRDAGYWLHLIRAVEEAGRRLYLQGRLPGSFYDGRGQEATAVGAALAMEPRDIACPLIRDMAVHLVRGVTPGEVFRHYLGKAGGPMEGRDGNVHLGSFERGTIPMISHLPEMLPVGMGVALSRTRRGEASAALAFCGDGATAGGVFHETLNLAALWRAPLVVVVERNRFANMTPERSYLTVPEIAVRAAGYGIRSWSGDGNDVLEVHALVGEALAHARSGGGPALVELHTYRMHGHGAHDDQRYVPSADLEAWGLHDPLLGWRTDASRLLHWSDGDQQSLEERVAREVGAGVEEALAAPYPPVDGLGRSLFAT
jgi:TPP-dependent pyruvate/acetoin dehydrogenase alpha subunit